MIHLRFVTRVHVIATLVVLSLVVYSAWVYPSLHVATRLTKAWAGSSRKIVVFGDSFSDTGAQVGDSSKQQTVSNAEPNSVKWAEVLCNELVCDTLVNFARTAVNKTTYSGGVVVDNILYANTTSQSAASLALLPDLKDQIQEWLAYESQLGSGDSDEEFIFALTVGVWDIWQYATLDLNAAQTAISSSIQTLFEQLDILAGAFDEPVQIMLPQLWDISFTPRFMSLALDHSSQSRRFSEEQHKLIYLIRYWNAVLLQHAANWKSGHIFVPDWNTWLLDEIRAVQMTRLGIYDSMKLASEAPAFKDVTNPCLRPLVPVETSDGSSVAMTVSPQCQDPRQHLFWDDTQFSAAAHELLGSYAFEMLAKNKTANAHVNLHPSGSDSKSGKSAVGMPPVRPSLAPGN